MIQNSSPVTNDASEPESSRHTGNSYANIDPSTLNPAPVPPAGMCIPTNYVNVTPTCVTSSQDTTQGQQTEQRHSLDLNHVSEISKNSTKAETPGQAGENKVTDDVQGQDNVLTEVQGKNNEEYVDTNLANSLEGVDVPDTGKLPEYMNVDVPQDQKTGATKKVPAPPVPPRGKVTFISFYLSYSIIIL